MHGSLTYRGRPQSGCEVRLCDLDAGEVIAGTVTGAAGEFDFGVPRPSRALVVARCSDEAIGVAGAEPGDGDIQLEIESGGPVYPLQVQLESERPAPTLDLALDALELSRADPIWLGAARVPFGGVARGALATKPLPVDGTTLQVQAGRWRLAAKRIVAATARAPGMDVEPSWITDRATVGGRSLVVKDGDVEIEIGGPTEVLLHVRPL